MAKQYFSIPLGALPVLVEMQNLLRRRLPAGTQFNDPATFHVTLVYLEDDKGLDLTFDEIAADLPVFGVGSDIISTFETPEGRSVHMRLEHSPQLTYLQSAIYYRAQAAGAKISEHSYPNRWRPHITLATIPTADGTLDVNGERIEVWLQATVHLEARSFAVTTDGSFEAVKTWPLRTDIPIQEFMKKIEANMETKTSIRLQEQMETVNNRSRVTIVCASEMKGGYPDIKLPADIDIAGIQAMGHKFVTLPIGEINVTSLNGHRYTEAAYKAMVAQINEHRHEGGWGHIKEENMGTEYSPPAIRWLAAKIDNKGVVWGKGVPLTADADNYFEMARLTNARVGTSLHAWAVTDGDNVIELELIKLDLADPARVGVPMTAARPQLSTEMRTEEGEGSDPAPAAQSGQPGGQPSLSLSENKSEEDTTVTGTEARVTELELERKTLREEISRLETDIKKLKDVASDANDVRELLGIAPDADFVKQARQFKEQYDEMAGENAALLMDSATAVIAEKVKVESVRPIVLELVAAKKAVTRKQLTRAIDDVLEQASVKDLLKVKVSEEMGPAQTGAPAQQPDGNVKTFLKPKPEVK